MQLTGRQKAFLEKVLDVYYHTHEPIHYTELAGALGVANTTAYEMLKLLESKGYLASEYRLADGYAGRGRSIVVFRPTLKALRMVRQLIGEDARHRDLQFIRDRVIERIQGGSFPDDELLAELLLATPEDNDPASFCAQVIAASLLSLPRQLSNHLKELSMFQDSGTEEANIESLDLLPGFALGLVSTLRQNPLRLARLTEIARKYEANLRQTDTEARLRLVRFCRDLVAAMELPLTRV